VLSRLLRLTQWVAHVCPTPNYDNGIVLAAQVEVAVMSTFLNAGEHRNPSGHPVLELMALVC
jgi:hypothetical protein